MEQHPCFVELEWPDLDGVLDEPSSSRGPLRKLVQLSELDHEMQLRVYAGLSCMAWKPILSIEAAEQLLRSYHRWCGNWPVIEVLGA